jgi:hypothetical protein
MVTGAGEEAVKVTNTPAVTDGVGGTTPAHPA